jgi:hypothetical protein
MLEGAGRHNQLSAIQEKYLECCYTRPSPLRQMSFSLEASCVPTTGYGAITLEYEVRKCHILGSRSLASWVRAGWKSVCLTPRTTGSGFTKTVERTPADSNSVTSDCDQVFIDLSSTRSMRLLRILPNGPRLRAHVARATSACRNLVTQP